MRGLSVFMAALCMTVVGAPALMGQDSQMQQAASQSVPAPTAFDPSRSDAKAIEIADKVAESMGGADTWAKTSYIKFTFVVMKGDKRLAERTHYWDRKNHRARMEGPSKEGGEVIAVVNLDTQEGQATIDGQLLFDKDAKKFTELAYRNLIADSYWLFMPFKLKDPGVRLRYDGELKAGPITYDKLRVSFEEGTPGFTPGDKYWLYVNRADNTIDQWSYVLGGQGASASPTAWQWMDWTTVGKLKVSLRKTQSGGEVDIVLENVEIYDSLPDSVFTSTAPVDPATLASGY